MLVVKVELWSAITGKRKEIAWMTIDNIGGTPNLGDYRCRALRGRDAETLQKATLAFDKKPTREGRVHKHPRLREHVWNLVAKCLTAMNYGDIK